MNGRVYSYYSSILIRKNEYINVREACTIVQNPDKMLVQRIDFGYNMAKYVSEVEYFLRYRDELRRNKMTYQSDRLEKLVTLLEQHAATRGHSINQL